MNDKLDQIIVENNNKLLDAVNGRTNPVGVSVGDSVWVGVWVGVRSRSLTASEASHSPNKRKGIIMSLEEKIDELFRTISHGSGLGLRREQWEMFQKGESFWKDAVIDLIKEERRNGFYMACGVCGIERDRVDELYEKCVAQLQAELKEEK